MLKAMSVILMCGAAFPALSQSTTQYKVGAITAVQLHHSAAGSNPSADSYDVSLKVDETTYVVLYTPPYGLQTVLYATGREFLVLVGEKTITFNDKLGTSSELPIESQTAAEMQSNPSNEVQSSSRPSIVAQSRIPTQCTEVIGLAGIKEKTEGTLTIDDGKLYFAHSGSKSQIAAAAMEDVVTADDSQRVIRGTLGTITMFGPYGSGRVLSMFRSKIDTLTIQYRDDNGGLHGVIFAMPAGTAEAFKQELIAKGAHTSIPAPASASVDSPHQVAVEGKQ
jgi:hypothetical protein